MNDRPNPPSVSGGYVLSLLGFVVLLYLAAEVLRFFGAWRWHPLAMLGLLPVIISVCTVVALAIGISVSAYRRRRVHDRERRGHCVRCDYDLKGVRHERCPECGVLILRRRDPVTGKEID